MSNRPIWDSAACPELKMILHKLEERFGQDLCLLPSDPEWLTFRVYGLTELALLQTLQREQQRLFGGDLMRFQILTEQTGKERGVSIRYLPDASAVLNSYSGFWFY